MKKKLSVFVSSMFAFVLSMNGQSVNSIKGRIIDAQNQQGIEAATISLENGQYVQSNDKGYFEISSGRKSSLNATISSVGYRSKQQLLQPGSSNMVILERINLFMQPVEVKATRAGDKAPFTKTNLNKQDIEKSNLGQDLPFLLNQVPSVIINSDAGNGVGYTGIRIRGSDATRINMTLNGIPYNDAESQGLFFVNLPDLASSVQSVQIQRGVGTSSNGAGAFGATINFSTNEVNTDPYAELNNSIGSFNTWKHTVKAGSGLLNDHFTIDARLSSITSDGYIDRASSDLKSFFVSAAYLSEKSSLRFNILSGKEHTYQAWNGVSASDLDKHRTINYAGMEKPGEPYDNETDNYQQDHYQLFFNHKFSDMISFNTALFLTKGKGYYEQYKAGESYEDYGLQPFTVNNETLSETDLIRQLWLDNSFYGQVFSLMYKDDRNQLDFGGGWNKYDGKHFGEIIWANAGIDKGYRWYEHPANKSDINAYLKYQRKLNDHLYAFGDLQLRNVHYTLDGFRDNPSIMLDSHYNFFNPKIGLSYTMGRNLFYASYSKASKEPNRDDFEAGGTEQPRPEHLHDFEMGWELKNAHTQLQATAYYMLYKDQLVLTGKVNDVGAYTRTNISDSYRLGLELSGTQKITGSIQASANLSLSRNRINDFVEYFDDYDNGGQKNIPHGNTDISFSPAVVAGISLQWMPVKGVELSVPAKYVSRQYLDNTSDKARSLDPYYVQDIRASYTLHGKFIKRAAMILQVNNIFNKKYEPNGYSYSYLYEGKLTTENYYYPMSGTNFMLGLNISL